ncbi:MAG: M1 family aminopeptidase, partial [Blastocatellia bacterium]
MRRNFEARVLMDMLWPGSGGLFVAYFNGKRYGDLLFGLDPLGNPSFTPEEVMLMALSESNYGAWISEHLEGHYKNPGVFDEDHSLIDITNQDIDATIKGKKLTATAKTSFNSLVDGARVIPFNLFGRLRVAKITDEAGQNVKFIQEKREEDADLFVILYQGLKKGASHTLTFEYSGDNAVADLGGNNFTLARRTNWYPNNAGNPLGDRAMFEITLRVPKGLTAIATGDPVGQPAQEGGFTTTKWKTSVPIDVAGFNYGKYKTEVAKDDKVNCTIESYANDEVPDYIKDYQRRLEERQAAGYETFTTLDSINPAVLMKKARAEGELAVGLYTDYFGPIPYTRIAMTEQPFFNFGQAWPMLVYMPVIAYLDSTQRHQMGMDRANNFFKVVGPHEVSHQWWGHILGWKSYRDQWMSEGFANFSASLFAQAFYKGKDDFYLA